MRVTSASGGLVASDGDVADTLEQVATAISKAGYSGSVKLSLSVGPDTFFDGEAYNLGHKDENAEVSLKLNTEGLSDFYVEMCSKYPIAGIMDPFESEDWESPRKLSERLGETIHVIGYHQIKSNNVLFEKAMRANSSDALCVKLNDIATVWETISLVKAAREASKPIHLRCALGIREPKKKSIVPVDIWE